MHNKLLVSLLGVCLSLGVFAQEKTAPLNDANGANTNNIASKTEGLEKMEGYYNLYWDDAKGKLWLEVARLEEEFLYVNSLSAGVGSNDLGLDRGQLGGSRIVFFKKMGNRLLLIEPNYDYRAESENPDEVRAVREAFARSVHWGFTIEAQEDNRYLVDATNFFLRDAHNVVGRLKQLNQGSYKLEASRSAIHLERTKNFPKNTEIDVLLTFVGTPTGGYIRSVTPTPEAVTVQQHHSFVELPDDGYEPRTFDPRAGYYYVGYMDYATPIQEPMMKRLIARHRLQKKNPEAEVSEPVEPIIYYLDRGTPEPVRSALLEGARWWNQAFEAAGYKDAFQVRMMPEGADPMDLRYNVIQWVHRSTRGWSYGASVRDPRTGEIIKGHVSLGSLRVRQDFLIASGLIDAYIEGQPLNPEMEKMALARLRQLSAHEVGHTLGLVHNYAASMKNRASVMDYPHPFVQLKNGKIDLSEAYDTGIGEWDKVAITYGYADFPEGTNETQALHKILEDAYQKGFYLMSDADARPEGSAHPDAHLWDSGSDAAEELERVLEIRTHALANLDENNIRWGAPMATLEEVMVPMYMFHRYQLEATAKVIGGLNYRYALRNDGQTITEMIPTKQQMNALDALLKTIAPETLAIPEELLQKIPPRPLGINRSRETFRVRTGLTFDPLGAAESAANLTLSFLLQHERIARLIEYKARDNKQPGAMAVLNKVIDATVKQSPSNAYHAEIQRVVATLTVHHLMALAANAEAAGQVRAIARFKLQELAEWMAGQNTTNDMQQAYYASIMTEIEEFLEEGERTQVIKPLRAPDGSPIGSDSFHCGGF